MLFFFRTLCATAGERTQATTPWICSCPVVKRRSRVWQLHDRRTRKQEANLEHKMAGSNGGQSGSRAWLSVVVVLHY